jgi:hypothetical protein
MKPYIMGVPEPWLKERFSRHSNQLTLLDFGWLTFDCFTNKANMRIFYHKQQYLY